MQLNRIYRMSGVLVLLAALLTACRQHKPVQGPLVNLQHLNYLYTHLTMDGQKHAGIVIYCEYPDYAYVEARGEGLICVDDMARAAIVYLRYGKYHNEPQALRRAHALIRTILHLQAANGCFYNFITAEGKIQKELKNSRPLPNWWTWRAFWALAEYVKWYHERSSSLLDSVQTAIKKVLPQVDTLMLAQGRWQTIQGFKVPCWLPQTFAADQGALLLKALTTLYAVQKEEKQLKQIRTLADAILAMQVKDERSPFYGAFLSWQNVWHAYGNSQADALFDAFEATGDSAYFKAARLEVTRFYGALQEQNYLHSARLKNDHGRVKVLEAEPFEQIAYDFRPMIWATVHAWRLTGEPQFLQQILNLTAWFSGKNIAGKAMYDPQTGRCFDGIVSETNVNLNSGAESTIEALLALMEVERWLALRQRLAALWP